eukprot:CAMPEP_0196823704 /NCGR_PEP_ID=MMETSP1362-20130617/88568_1 /TAXON_ID=163516 /ORGANISM="Leptocylindrus danicus, Strain CCMP1856" /LENGTH=121 /DNA_ID=CAMNT_0042203673 /DNA_START=695 /DNA_END=1057 /DNA_ORIENTATION=+
MISLKEARARQQRILNRYHLKFEFEGAAWIIQQAWRYYVEFYGVRNKAACSIKLDGKRKNVKPVYNRDMLSKAWNINCPRWANRYLIPAEKRFQQKSLFMDLDRRCQHEIKAALAIIQCAW